MPIITNITFDARPDRDNTGTGAGLSVLVAQNFSGELKADSEFLLSDMDTDTLEAWNKVVDYFTFDFEATYAIIKVDYDDVAKEFDLSGSYVRSAASTLAPSKLTDGFPITMRAEFPGFETNTVVEVTLLYNQALSAPDVTALADVGVVLTGDGELFTIANDRECKITFAKPAAESGKYILDYPALGAIIPADA